MGNLRRYMKLTFFTFGIGWLAIAGIPPLSGFFAKGDILDNAFARYPALWAVGLVTAALTAYYMTQACRPRLLRGRPVARSARPARPGVQGGEAEPHESPRVMALPLVVLAVLALAGVPCRPARAPELRTRWAGWPRSSAPPSTRPTSHRGRSGPWPSSTPWWR